MGGCRCSYKNCKSATKVSENLHFFHYPVKNVTRCKQWIENANRPAFVDLPEDQLRNKVVCELHFETRCFTNVSRKRLVHDAVPTLDGGCEGENTTSDSYQSQQYDDVQILPANDDGTIFTVDSESMQQISDLQKVESYIYKNGSLLPLFKSESLSDSADTSDQIIYTIADSDFGNFNDVRIQQNGNQFLLGDNSQQSLISNDLTPLETSLVQKPSRFSFKQESVEEDEEIELVVQDDVLKEDPNMFEDSSMTEEYVMDCNTYTIKTSGSEKKGIIVEKKYIQQLKRHGKEIASIKRALQEKTVPKPIVRKKVSKSCILNSLQGRIPPTLQAALSLSLEKKTSNFSKHELEFLTTMYSVSPAAYNTLSEKFKWTLPNPIVVKKLANRKGDWER